MYFVLLHLNIYSNIRFLFSTYKKKIKSHHAFWHTLKIILQT